MLVKLIIGLSKFCDLEDETIPEPRLWSQQVMNEYAGRPQKPDFLNRIATNERFMARNPFIFSKMKSSYDAYEKDIAVLHIYFERNAVFQFRSEPSLTWTRFLSQIGGLMALCLGMSIATCIELPLVLLRLISHIVSPVRVKK
jgi:hypothetical protein